MEEDHGRAGMGGGEGAKSGLDIPEFVSTKTPTKRATRMEGRTFSLSSSSGGSENDSDDDMMGGEADRGEKEPNTVRREYAETGGKEVDMLKGLGLNKGGRNQQRVDGKGMTFPRPKGASKAKAEGKPAAAEGEEQEDEAMDNSEDEDYGTVGQGEEDLYDPDLDDLDQQFVDTRRERHAPGFTGKEKKNPLPPSKAWRGGEDAHDDEDDDGVDAADPCSSSGTANGGDQGAGGDAGGRECEWKAYLAPIGHPYYHNTKTGEVTWIKPASFRGDGTSLAGPKTQTDAVLSCPCCFALLCLDCQQHARYHNQFRAMFVQNCDVDKGEVLRPGGGHSGNVHPVRCSTCQADVGVMDMKDEVFHFYDVIPSSG